MRERSPVVVVVLSLVTFSIYAYFWLYSTTYELKEETGREDLNPGLDLLLAIVTLGLWGLYASFRNAQIVHEELLSRGKTHEDSSVVVLLFNALTFVSGLAWLVSLAVLQDDYNRLVASHRLLPSSAGSALQATS